MYVIANDTILKKKYMCESLVELYGTMLVRFSIFSIQVALTSIVGLYRTCITTCASLQSLPVRYVVEYKYSLTVYLYSIRTVRVPVPAYGLLVPQ